MGYLRVHEIEKSSCVLIMSMRRGTRKLWLGLWNEIFLDSGYVETISFLYTIIILKVGPLSYSILKFLFYIVTFQKLTL